MKRTLYGIATGRGARRRYITNDDRAPGFALIQGTRCGLVDNPRYAAVGGYMEAKAALQYWSERIGQPCGLAKV